MVQFAGSNICDDGGFPGLPEGKIPKAEASKAPPFSLYAGLYWLGHVREAEGKGVPGESMVSLFSLPSISDWPNVMRMLYMGLYGYTTPMVDSMTIVHTLVTYGRYRTLEQILQDSEHPSRRMTSSVAHLRAIIDTPDLRGCPPTFHAVSHGEKSAETIGVPKTSVWSSSCYRWGVPASTPRVVCVDAAASALTPKDARMLPPGPRSKHIRERLHSLCQSSRMI